MWYYVDNGQQKGPFDEAQLESLITAGTVTHSTFVWKEGLANWMPLSQVRGGTAGDTCQICQKLVGAENLIELNSVRVCAACKPVALQKMREGISVGSDEIWVEGKKMVARDGAHFPARCVKCNKPTTEAALTRKLLWNHPLLLLLIFTPYLGILAYIIVAVITRRRAVIHIHICPEHRQRRLYALIGTWTGIPLAFALIIAGAVYHMIWLSVLGILLAVGAVVLGVTRARYTRTTRIDKTKTVWLRGAGKEFLASLPPWTGS